MRGLSSPQKIHKCLIPSTKRLRSITTATNLDHPADKEAEQRKQSAFLAEMGSVPQGDENAGGCNRSRAVLSPALRALSRSLRFQIQVSLHKTHGCCARSFSAVGAGSRDPSGIGAGSARQSETRRGEEGKRNKPQQRDKICTRGHNLYSGAISTLGDKGSKWRGRAPRAAGRSALPAIPLRSPRPAPPLPPRQVCLQRSPHPAAPFPLPSSLLPFLPPPHPPAMQSSAPCPPLANTHRRGGGSLPSVAAHLGEPGKSFAQPVDRLSLPAAAPD